MVAWCLAGDLSSSSSSFIIIDIIINIIISLYYHILKTVGSYSFIKNVLQNAGNGICETLNLNIYQGSIPLRLSNFLPVRTPSKSHISTLICSWNSISFFRITGGYSWRPDQWWFSMANGVSTLLVYYHLWHLEQKKHPPHSLASSLLKPKTGYEVNQKGTLWLLYYFIFYGNTTTIPQNVAQCMMSIVLLF